MNVNKLDNFIKPDNNFLKVLNKIVENVNKYIEVIAKNKSTNDLRAEDILTNTFRIMHNKSTPVTYQNNFLTNNVAVTDSTKVKIDNTMLPLTANQQMENTFNSEKPSEFQYTEDELKRYKADYDITVKRLNAQKLDKDIERFSTTYNIPKDIVYSVITAESTGRIGAQSNKNARGLMQVMPGTFRDMLGNANQNDPVNNLHAGIKYLRYLADSLKYNEEDLKNPEQLKYLFAAYNAGLGRVNKDGTLMIPNIKETQDYVRKNIAILSKIIGES
jgi:uncharacterized protein (DUF2267 family)